MGRFNQLLMPQPTPIITPTTMPNNASLMVCYCLFSTRMQYHQELVERHSFHTRTSHAMAAAKMTTINATEMMRPRCFMWLHPMAISLVPTHATRTTLAAHYRAVGSPAPPVVRYDYLFPFAVPTVLQPTRQLPSHAIARATAASDTTLMPVSSVAARCPCASPAEASPASAPSERTSRPPSSIDVRDHGARDVS